MRKLLSSSLLFAGPARLLALAAAAVGLGGTPSAHAQCPSSFAAAVNYGTGTTPYTVATGDFNNDGRLDLVVSNNGSNNISVLLGTGGGGGAFAPAINSAAGAGPLGVATGDFNNDGRLDLVVANFNSSTVSVLLGTGTGAFGAPIDYNAGANPWYVAVKDLNGDGRPDLAVANFASNNVSVLLANGLAGFATAVNYPVGASPRSVAAGDFNGDGLPDLAVANFNSSTVSVLLGTGGGAFAAQVNYVAGSNPASVAAADFNADGRLDLAVANFNSTTVSVLLGNGGGGGTFAAPVNYTAAASPIGVAVGDFNGDGQPDLAVSSFSSTGAVAVLLGTGGGAFAAPVNYAVGAYPFSVAVGDLNGDGRADLALANSSSNNVSVLLNTATGFLPPVFTAQPVSQVVQSGGSVSLIADAIFYGGPPQYQWRRNGVPLTNGGNISGATTPTLNIAPVSASDMATYDVQAISQSCIGAQNSVNSTQAVLAVTTPVTIANNNCSDATRIGNGTYSFSTAGATTDGPTEANLGFCCGDLQVNQDVWFIYTATCSGVATVALCGSNYDSKVAVYNSTTCPTGPNTAIAGNDDSAACGGTGVQSRTTFTAVSGHEYLIRVGGYTSAVGTVAMAVSCDGSACLVADMGMQGGVAGRDGQLDNNDFIVFIDAFFNHTGCP